MQIRAFVIQTWSLGLQNFDKKGKSKRILVVAVKWRHRANGLLLININLEYQSWFSLVRNHCRVLHVPLVRLINIPGVYSRRCSYSFGNGFVSIWSQGLVDSTGRSARVIIKCRSRFYSIKISNLMLAPDSHFVCLISLQSYWEKPSLRNPCSYGWQWKG